MGMRPIPELTYLPRDPREYHPAIGLIGCGSITEDHLSAYRSAGYDVVALCDVNLEQAKTRQSEFFPEADLYQDYRDLLRRDDIQVVDIATHPPVRPPIIEAALEAGKHVLSQKPFVLDLDLGLQLVDLAEKKNVKLAVNQNGRWAPHFSYTRAAIDAGLLGDVFAAHLGVHWDHTWVAGTEFENVKHLILYDFAIHWFDILLCFFQREPTRVFASLSRSPGQKIRPDLLAQAMVQFDGGHASLVFDANTQIGPEDRTYVVGTEGTISSSGPDLKQQTLTLTTEDGSSSPRLVGKWFPDAFRGTMGELFCAIEESREPSISAASNLKSLALCFAAVASAETGKPMKPGQIRKLPGG